MTDNDRAEPDLIDTPIMPTGSGVADLEIARELDAVSEGSVLTGNGVADVPTIDDAAARASEGQPS